MLPAVGDRLGILGAGVHIGEAGVLHSGKDRDRQSQGQDSRHAQSGQAFCPRIL